MCDLPVQIPDSELVARFALKPRHFNNNGTRIRNTIFRRNDSKGISVVRFEHFDASFVLQKGTDLEQLSPEQTFDGYLIVSADQVRRSAPGQIDVVDSRAEYCGHADIKYLFTVPPEEEDEPSLVEQKALLSRIADKLLEFAHENKYVKKQSSE